MTNQTEGPEESDKKPLDDMPEPAKKIRRLMMLAIIIAIIGGSLLMLTGCANSASTLQAQSNCAEDEERVRIGPRGQLPDYVCR